jgi:anti-sigma regulatory factor (Ser/Thr protein kinase)
LAACLGDELDPDVLHDSQLCVSELAANAVRHAATPFRVEMDRDDRRVRVSVHDDHPGVPRPSGGDPTRPSGRGLFIVDAIAARWGWTSVPDGGKYVWFELDSPGGQASGRQPG